MAQGWTFNRSRPRVHRDHADLRSPFCRFPSHPGLTGSRSSRVSPMGNDSDKPSASEFMMKGCYHELMPAGALALFRAFMVAMPGMKELDKQRKHKLEVIKSPGARVILTPFEDAASSEPWPKGWPGPGKPLGTLPKGAIEVPVDAAHVMLVFEFIRANAKKGQWFIPDPANPGRNKQDNEGKSRPAIKLGESIRSADRVLTRRAAAATSWVDVPPATPDGRHWQRAAAEYSVARESSSSRREPARGRA